jgi:hypothetical protein
MWESIFQRSNSSAGQPCASACGFCVGEVAGLLPKDELDMIVNDIRPVMKAQAPGTPDTWENLYAFFLNRVRDNLHMVLCFSPVGPKFARRAQSFPGLINGTTIDWCAAVVWKLLPWVPLTSCGTLDRKGGGGPMQSCMHGAIVRHFVMELSIGT